MLMFGTAAPPAIWTPVTDAVWPWLAETTPLMSVGGWLGVVGLSSSQAWLTVMTQPISNARSASAVNSRRVGSSGSSGDCSDSFKADLLTSDGMSEAIRQDKCRPIVTNSLDKCCLSYSGWVTRQVRNRRAR